jgi:protein gp37
MDAGWVREVRDQCIENSVAFNFKRWGGLRPKANGRPLDGREWNEFPDRPAASASAKA